MATSSVASHPFASPIPWRKAGVRYNNNEIYFDVVETLEAIVNKYVCRLPGAHNLTTAPLFRNGTPAVSTIRGRVDSNCKLSGTPDLLLSFSNAQSLHDCSFHPCVRYVPGTLFYFSLPLMSAMQSTTMVSRQGFVLRAPRRQVQADGLPLHTCNSERCCTKLNTHSISPYGPD